MKTVKLFSREEIEKATDIDFFEVIDGFSNNCAISWWVECEDKDYVYENERERFYIETRNKVNEYLLSHGAEEDELVYIDITW